MPVLGNATKPSNSWGAYEGHTYPSQMAEKLQHTRAIRILQLGSWIGGWNGTCRVRLTVWRYSDRVVIAQSAEIVVPNKGAGGPSGGNVNSIVGAVVAPVDIPANTPFYVGWVSHHDDGMQFSFGSTSSGQHIEGKIGENAYPGAPLANATLIARRVGAWVQDYADMAGAHVYRGSAFTRAEVVVQRGAAKSPAQRVAVYRNGAWVDGG